MPAPNINDSNGLLLYRVGPVLVCSPTMPVEAVIMPPKITVPPGANVAEPGVFKSIHGLVRLVDLRVRFGVDKEDYTTPGKIIIVEVVGGHAGFWVDEIEDVTGFPTTGWAPVPAYIPQNIFSQTWIKNKTIRLYAEFEKLDKFKASGYLRKHIEMIKSADAAKLPEASTQDNKIKHTVSKKNIENNSTQIHQVHRIKSEDVNEHKVDEIILPEKKEETKLGSKVENKTEHASSITENNNIKYHHSTVSVNSVKEDSNDKNKGFSSALSSANSMADKTLPQRSDNNVDLLIVKNDFKKANSDSFFKNVANITKPSSSSRLMGDSKKADNKIEPSSLISNKNHQQKESHVNKSDDNAGFKWGVAIGGLAIVIVYLLLMLLSDDGFKSRGAKQYIEPVETVKEIIAVEKEVVYEQKIIKSEPDHSAGLGAGLGPALGSDLGSDLDSGSGNNFVIEQEVSLKVEATVNISKVEDGVLIIINDYEEPAIVVSEDVEAEIMNNSEFEVKHIKQVETSNVKVYPDTGTGTSTGTGTGTGTEDVLIEGNDVKVVIEKSEVEKEAVVNDNEKSRDEVINDQQAIKVFILPAENLSAKNVIIGKEKTGKEKKNKVNRILSKKYVHVVIKGDTLWHIAKRYVNNPWRYPELAKLSRIKNPDLIYPGDQVTIIINYKN